MAEFIHTVVIGAGVVGLAIAKSLAESGREVLVVERAQTTGTETSSRNSEVIHAGIYYPHGSLKARLCVAGRRLLYAYCQSRHVDYRKSGKLIVASSSHEIPQLIELQEKARLNGLVDDDERLRLLDADDVRRLEPMLECTAALWSPSSGTVDSHGLMLAYQGDAELHGACCVFNTEVKAVRIHADGFLLSCDCEGLRYELACAELVNSAGLKAQAVAAATEGFPEQLIPEQLLVKGSYFCLQGQRAPFSHLIYPLPNELGLGIHLTLDMAGEPRFGPDTEVVDQIDYAVDSRRADIVYGVVRKYWPALKDGVLKPSYSGIRPKIKSSTIADFTVVGPKQHGLTGHVALFGIESPGLTASLALADLVRSLLDNKEEMT